MKKLEIIEKQLKELGYSIGLCGEEDLKPLYEIFYDVVEAGIYFPYESSSWEEFQLRFFEKKSLVYVCRNTKNEVIGGFYLKANFPGRSNHIANAGYMVSQKGRGNGVGRLMGEYSLTKAKDLGFLGMQFNAVLSQNQRAVDLWKKLGFEIIGEIPEALRNNDGTYQALYIMYRSL